MKILVVCTTDSMIWNFLVYHIKEFEKRGHVVECACSETGFYFEELIRSGIKMHKIPFERNPFRLSNVKAYFLLNKLVKENSYDTIFCHEPVGGALGRIVGNRNRCKVIYMAHGFHFFKGAKLLNKIIFKRIEKYLSYKTDLLITINNEDYEASKKIGAKRNEHIKGIGIDISKFKKNKSLILQNTIKEQNIEDITVLLSVGELIHRKNHESIIKAIAMINDKKVHYFIAGEGKLREYLLKLSKRLKLEKNIHFLGFCRNINELCNSCDIFIFPSLQEGLSIALMEAMACGKPVICSNIRGNIDLVENYKGGILVAPYDVKAYSQAIVKLAKEKKTREIMGKNNQYNVTQYDLQMINSKLINLIESV